MMPLLVGVDVDAVADSITANIANVRTEVRKKVRIARL